MCEVKESAFAPISFELHQNDNWNDLRCHLSYCSSCIYVELKSNLLVHANELKLELKVWNVDENNLCCFNEFLNFFFLPENVNDDGCILLHPKNVPPFLASFVVLKKKIYLGTYFQFKLQARWNSKRILTFLSSMQAQFAQPKAVEGLGTI